MRRNLTLQIVLPTIFMVTVALAVLGVWQTNQYRQWAMDQATEQLNNHAAMAEVAVGAAWGVTPPDALAARIHAATGAGVLLILPEGMVAAQAGRVSGGPENPFLAPEVRAALRDGQAYERSGGDLRVAVVSRRGNGDINAIVVLVRDITSALNRFNRMGWQWALWVLGIMFLLAGTVSFYTANVSTLLQNMSTVAARIARGPTADRATVTGPHEVSDLARALNSMADSLQLELQRVQSSAERLEVVLSSTRDGVVLIDANGNIELLNSAAEAMLGFRAASAVGIRENLLDRYPDLGALLKQARQEGLAINRRVSLSGSGAGVMRAAVVPLVSGRILITVQDLTEVYRAVDIRRDFVANVSHELRTPLTALGLMVENLLRGAIDDKELARDFLRRMAGEIDRLTKMVLELLLLSRLESDREPLLKSEFSISELISEVVEDLRGLWGDKRQRIEHRANDIFIDADRAKIKQVLINLLDNAIKFSPPASAIAIAVEQSPIRTTISVRDEGPGIATEHLPRVYERFFKGTQSRGGGTGLGLAIVKHIVEAHEGSVAVESKAGGGATFIIVLPN